MSRVGSRPIKIEEGVEVKATPTKVSVTCGANSQEINIADNLSVSVEDGVVKVSRKNEDKDTRSKHGLTARLIKNAIFGVKNQFERVLEFSGTGYRASINGNELTLNMGYSHEIKLNVPEGLKVSVVKNSIVITGVEKDTVGQFAANIREIRPPEVYKGKGIKYKEEFIKRKAGKTAASK